MKLLYAFPEPLPLPRARSIQVAHAVASLAEADTEIYLAYVPADDDPFFPTGRPCPSDIHLIPLSRNWPMPLGRLPPFSRWHSVRFFAHRLRGEIAHCRPDLLYVRHVKLAAMLLKQHDALPLVYEAHEVFADTTNSRHRARIATLEYQVMRFSAAVICNSQATAKRLIELYGVPRRLLILPNGVAPLPSLPDKPWTECRQHIIYAGSFFGWKGVTDLMRAAYLLPGFRITLIGGELEQMERLRALQLDRGAKVELLPRCPPYEVMQRLATSCIAVLPNRPDPDSAFTSPIKLFEYMAAGCAVVAADIPPIREIMEPNEAIWFRSGDFTDLARALNQAASDCEASRRLGEKLRQKSTVYTWQARARKLRSFLEDVLE